MKRSLLYLLTLLAASLMMLAGGAASAGAAYGELDTTFNGSGSFLLSGITGGGPTETDFKSIVQPDGKIVAIGNQVVGGVTTGVIIKLNANGTPDAGFGDGDGVLNINFGTDSPLLLHDVAVQPSGKIVAAGSLKGGTGQPWQGIVLRVRSDASASSPLDGGFGGTGNYTIALSNHDVTFYDLDFDSTGRIVVAGDRRSTVGGPLRPIAYRFAADGAPDTTFNSNANTALDAIGTTGYGGLSAVARAGTGVLLAGVVNVGNPQGLFVRLDASGNLDPAFNLTGTLLQPVPAPYDSLYISTLAARTGGDFVYGGVYLDGPTSKFGVGQIGANGATDSSFGTSGVTFASYASGTERPTAIAVKPDGSMFVAGTSAANLGLVLALSSAGQPDATFGPGGWSAIDFGASTYEGATGIAVQADGRVIVSGFTALIDQLYIVRLQAPEPATDPMPLPLPGLPLPVAPLIPTTKITSPGKSKTKATKLKELAGSAGPVNGVAKVEIAVQRIDKPLLKKLKKCLWLKSAKAKFSKIKATNGKCATPAYQLAAGGESWTYALKAKLAKGSYVLTVRATATDGTVQALPTTKKFKIG